MKFGGQGSSVAHSWPSVHVQATPCVFGCCLPSMLVFHIHFMACLGVHRSLSSHITYFPIHPVPAQKCQCQAPIHHFHQQYPLHHVQNCSLNLLEHPETPLLPRPAPHWDFIGIHTLTCKINAIPAHMKTKIGSATPVSKREQGSFFTVGAV